MRCKQASCQGTIGADNVCIICGAEAITAEAVSPVPASTAVSADPFVSTGSARDAAAPAGETAPCEAVPGTVVFASEAVSAAAAQAETSVTAEASPSAVSQAAVPPLAMVRSDAGAESSPAATARVEPAVSVAAEPASAADGVEIVQIGDVATPAKDRQDQSIQLALDLRQTSIKRIRDLLQPAEVSLDRGLLSQAANELKSVFPYNYDSWRLQADLLMKALHQLETRQLQADATFTLMAIPLREGDLRDAAEVALRQCAHFADSHDKMISAIDEANHVRRKTWF